MWTFAAPTSAFEPNPRQTAEPPSGRIGPNAAIQLIAALRGRGETETLERLFQEAGLERWLEAPPQSMIDARDAARLHVGLRRLAPAGLADLALAEAGRRTADYLLGNRIPRLAQTLLKRLPARWSAGALMRAISAHAWTFAGSGRFEGEVGRVATVRIYANPLCEGLTSDRPACVWHAAVLERLFQALVAPKSRACEIECCAKGDACCRFEMAWRHSPAPGGSNVPS